MRAILTTGAALSLLMTIGSAPVAAASTPNAMAGFVRSCQTQMYMSQAACTCMAGKAQAELDAKEIAYLSVPANDGPAAAAAAKAMTGAEIGQVDKFMRTAPHECAP